MYQKSQTITHYFEPQAYLILNPHELELNSSTLLAKEEINLVFYVYNKT